MISNSWNKIWRFEWQTQMLQSNTQNQISRKRTEETTMIGKTTTIMEREVDMEVMEAVEAEKMMEASREVTLMVMIPINITKEKETTMMITMMMKMTTIPKIKVVKEATGDKGRVEITTEAVEAMTRETTKLTQEQEVETTTIAEETTGEVVKTATEKEMTTTTNQNVTTMITKRTRTMMSMSKLKTKKECST